MKTLPAAIGLIALFGSPAVAQTPAAPVTPPPVGTLSTTHETHAADALGNQSNSSTTTYRDSQGVAQDKQTTTTTVAPPPPPPPTTTTTTSTESTTAPR